MVKNTFTVTDPLGLHARPACDLVKEASKWESEIVILYKDKKINAKSIFELLSCAIKKGQEINIIASGSDEKEAMDAIKRLWEAGADEQR